MTSESPNYKEEPMGFGTLLALSGTHRRIVQTLRVLETLRVLNLPYYNRETTGWPGD